MLNVPVASLGQYSVCMDVPYRDFTTQAQLEACASDPNQYVAVGAKQEGSSTLALMAVARASEVFAQRCGGRLANGAYWYNCVGKSFGFAASSINLNTFYWLMTDMSSEQCEYRLSWLVDRRMGGFRAGCITHLFYSYLSDRYYKQIYILPGCTCNKATHFAIWASWCLSGPYYMRATY